MVQINNIHKTYNPGTENALHVLKGIDLTINQGEFVSIMGASGSGKSTLLNILGILDNYDEGEYFLDGRLIKNLTETEGARLRNELIGFVFQSFNLLPFKNAVENVALPLYYKGVGRRERYRRAMEELERMGLKDWAEHLPSEMSGGQKQRVAIAGVIAMQPDCIVLDEPTAMLDPSGRNEVIKTIKRLNKESGITVVLITHFMEEAVNADKVFVMDGGKIITSGTPYEVFSQVEILKKRRLNVPVATQLCYKLRACGVDIKSLPLTNEECISLLTEVLK